MDFLTWLFQFAIWANALVAQGYQYELGSGYFRGPQGDRVAITCCPAPRRGK